MILGVNGRRLVRVRVHGRYARVVLLCHEVAVLGEACRPMEHVHTGMWLLLLLLLSLLVWVDGRMAVRDPVVLVGAAGRQAMPMAVLWQWVAPIHVLAEVGKGGGAMEVVVAVMTHQGHAVGRRPLHDAAFWCRR